MSSADKFALAVLGLGLGTQVFWRPLLVKYLKFAFWASFLGIFGNALYWLSLQYQIWRQSGFGKYFLPPYQSASYFFYYAGIKFLAAPFIALAAAFLTNRVARLMNRHFGERFFEKEEFLLSALGVFLAGYPGFLLYLLLVSASAILLSTFYFLHSRNRAPLFYLWLPAAILAIIIKNYFVPQSILDFFII